MAKDFWFNRIVEYWIMPQGDELVNHIRRANIQVVQVGNFGPLLYGLADDPEIDRWSAGVPLYGLRENLDLAETQIARFKEAGARVVGQLSMAWHYGDPEQGRGLFGTWDKIWTDEFLGPDPPCPDAALTQQLADDGHLRTLEIPGRPYQTYYGCYCNPHWLAMLKAMVAKGLALGLDGFNVHHNFEKLCDCPHCQAYFRPHLAARFTADELKSLFGTDDLDQFEGALTPRAECPEPLQQAFALSAEKAANHRRKEAFDELFAAGRRQNPDLLLAQWYHKYDFRPHDERSLLPPELWAKDESYIWYSQGPWQRASSIAHGYLADMGLPGRYMYAAGRGRPYVINKYDYRRWRIWCGEALAYGGAAIAYHAGPPRLDQEQNANIAPEDFYGPVVRYQRFMAAQEKLLHPARPHSQIALVYPRRSEREAEMDCLDALKRLGRHLEDGHLLFDIILDDQLVERGGDYAILILPEVKRISSEEETFLRQYVERGGGLLFTGATGCLDPVGNPWPEALLSDWRVEPASSLCGHAAADRVRYLPTGPWIPDQVAIPTLDGAERPVYFLLDQDPFGQQFLAELVAMLGRPALSTDAPWFVRVHAWRPEQVDALVLHWINYRQDENSAVEVPLPTGSIQVNCAVPDGWGVERVEWLYSEMKEPLDLAHRASDQRVIFEIPTLIVHGMSVLYLHYRP